MVEYVCGGMEKNVFGVREHEKRVDPSEKDALLKSNYI